METTTPEDQLEDLLSWRTPLDLGRPLLGAVQKVEPEPMSSLAAVCFDTNILFHLRRDGGTEEFIDYFGSKHHGPLVVPAQTLVEAWNNHFANLESVAESIVKKFGELQELVEKIDPGLEDLQSGVSQLVDDLRGKYGQVLEGTAQTDLSNFVSMLTERAIFAQVDRVRFAPVAAQRKRLKVPPGFKDNGDGDFFVWADFLLGLLQAKASGAEFDTVILVTNDQKKDWSTRGRAHPVLTAEVTALFGVSFRALTLKEAKHSIQSAITAG